MTSLDPIFENDACLRVCALLNARGATQGKVNREMRIDAVASELHDDALDEHLAALAGAGYVVTSRDRKRDNTFTEWASLSQSGKAAFDSHVAALKKIAQ